MGELPCLRRSFSQPSGGFREAREISYSATSVSIAKIEGSKTTSPVIQKIKSLTNFTASLSVFKNNSASSQTKTKASVNDLKRPSLSLKSEDRSNRPLVNKSVAGGIIANQKQNTSSIENSKSPDGNGSKPRSSIITSPFRLRSEERAAKRKEFYEKLEQKRNTEEASANKIPDPYAWPRSPLLGRKVTTGNISDATSRPAANTESSNKVHQK